MTAPRPTAIVVAGLVALAVAMGIGRFAFTPILPMMLADRSVDLHGASWLATANYVGYLLGAVLCMAAPRLRERWPALPRLVSPPVIKSGLVATGVLAAAMALPLPSAWPALRFLAGVASAFVFLACSAWCLARLAEQGAPTLGAAMFAGPGAGIVTSGLVASALVAVDVHAAAAWALFGVAALALTAWVWPTFVEDAPASTAAPAAAAGPTSRVAPTSTGLPSTSAGGAVSSLSSAPPPASGAPAASPTEHPVAEVASLAVGYGLSGFGYIVTATFLPVIARTAIPGSRWLDLFWPVFGVGVVAGALLATRLRASVDLRRWLAAAYAVQAAGIGIGVAVPSTAGFALGSLLLGLPFTAITFFAMQEARRIRPASSASVMGLLTVLWALGQSAGPPVTSRLIAASADAGSGFDRSLVVAALALVLGAAIFAAMSWRWPRRR